MQTNVILRKKTEVILFLFTAFGAFLLNLAPPEKVGLIATGVSSFLSLGILLIISALTKYYSKKRLKNIFLIASIISLFLFFSTVLIYENQLRKYTYDCPEQSGIMYIAGTKMTEQTKEINEKYGYKNNKSKLAFEFACAKEEVWLEESIIPIENRLFFIYVMIVLSLAAMLFCSTELLKVPQEKASSRKS